MHVRLSATISVLVIAALLLVAAPAMAQAPGSLDPGFAGGSGVASQGVSLFGVGLGGDGTIFAGGNGSSGSVLARLSPSGQSEGASAGASGSGRAVAVQADGKVVVAVTGVAMEVERFNPDGTLDGSFGGGVVTIPGTPGGQANAVAIAPGGQIVVAGSALGGDTLPRVAVARLNRDGSLDRSFHGGVPTFNFTPSLPTYQFAEGVAVQADGRIVIVGNLRPGLQVTNGFVARLTTDGRFDPSFGNSSGNADVNPNIPCFKGFCFYYHPGGEAYASLNAVALQGDGKVVAAGVDIRGANGPAQPTCATDCPQAIVVRFSAGGSPDLGFGTGGIAALPSGANTRTGDPDGAHGVVIAGGGDIVAAGDFQEEAGGEVALWAFTPSGSPETRFGSGGTAITPLGGDAHGRAIAVMPDGRLVVAGDASGSGFVARYEGLGPPPGAPGPPPPPASPPGVQTGAATGVGPHSARVSGSVNPNGLPTSYFFQYGRTNAYGSSTTGGSLGSSSASTAVAQTLIGLARATTYHYRLVARSAAGTTVGEDRTLKTALFSASVRAINARERIAKLLRGLLISVHCSDGCRINAYLKVSKQTARRLGLRHRSLTIAAGSGSLRHGGTARLRVRLLRGLSGRVARSSSLSCTLQIVFSSPSRSRLVTFAQRVSFRR